jgi:hypothetical protein
VSFWNGCIHWGLTFGEYGGCFFHRAIEIKRYITRYVKMPCKQVSLSIGTPSGNWKGFSCRDVFEKKGKYIWVPFLYPEDIKILSLGTILNFAKGTGLCWANIRLWGSKGQSVKPRCNGTKGSNPLLIYLSAPNMEAAGMDEKWVPLCCGVLLHL